MGLLYSYHDKYLILYKVWTTSARTAVVPVCIGFAWQGFGSVGGYRGGFCEKLLEASPRSDGANANWLQDGPAAGQGWAHQQRW